LQTLLLQSIAKKEFTMFTKNILLLLILPILTYAININNYHEIFKCKKENNTTTVAIREFEVNSTKCYLTLNPNTLDTKIIKDYNFTQSCTNELNSTRYIKLLDKSISNKAHPLQNDGITQASSGTYLSTDLCPSSKKGFEHRLYSQVIKSFKNPVPITLFITSKWIQSHQEELNTLKSWQADGNLSITWGNHTALHIYHPKAPLEKNFVLSPEENLTNDILSLEISLIQEDITPSVFFRFPGLVSSKEAIKEVKRLGLITIGSKSWLAIKPNLHDGSIILTHGNKNEPKGVDILLKLIKDGNITHLNDIKEINLEYFNNQE
jgi:hypothetical protein